MKITLHSYDIEQAIKEYIEREYGMQPIADGSYIEMAVNQTIYKKDRKGKVDHTKKSYIGLDLIDNEETTTEISVFICKE